MTLIAVLLSNPVVGSSNMHKFGLFIMSYPIEVLFLSPPESPLRNRPPTGIFLHSFKPSRFIYSLTLFFISFLFKFDFKDKAKSNNSSGVLDSHRISSYSVNDPNF